MVHLMTILNENTSSPGWYIDPEGYRYWDGHQWGQKIVLPNNAPVAKVTKRIYWSNLFRIRVWWFSLTSGLVAAVILGVIGLPPALVGPLFLLTVGGVGWFWLHQQMSCHSCGTVLRVTRLSGGQEVCHKCGKVTDKSA